MSIFERITKSNIRSIIAVMSVTGSFVLLYLLVMKPIPESNKDVVLTAIGFVMGGLLGGVSGYFFGASKTDVKNSDE